MNITKGMVFICIPRPAAAVDIMAFDNFDVPELDALIKQLNDDNRPWHIANQFVHVVSKKKTKVKEAPKTAKKKTKKKARK